MPSDRRHTRFHFRGFLSLPILMALCGNGWARGITLPTIAVQGRPGSSANADITRDYKVNRVEVGPLGKRALIDTRSRSTRYLKDLLRIGRFKASAKPFDSSPQFRAKTFVRRRAAFRQASSRTPSSMD